MHFIFCDFRGVDVEHYLISSLVGVRLNGVVKGDDIKVKISFSNMNHTLSVSIL